MDNTVINYIGTSMFPTLKTGDILRVVPYKERTVRMEDVVVFHSLYGKTSIVHRVVSVAKECVRTKCDNNNKMDHWVLYTEDIIGKVYAQIGKTEATLLRRFARYSAGIS